jgi:hypothetical protein
MGPIVLLIPIVIYVVLVRWERRVRAQTVASERAEFHRTLDRLEGFGPPSPVIDLAIAAGDATGNPSSVSRPTAA